MQMCMLKAAWLLLMIQVLTWCVLQDQHLTAGMLPEHLRHLDPIYASKVLTKLVCILALLPAERE